MDDDINWWEKLKVKFVYFLLRLASKINSVVVLHFCLVMARDWNDKQLENMVNEKEQYEL